MENNFLKNRDNFQDRWHAACKPVGEEPCLGLEVEQFVVDSVTGKSRTYSGKDGVEAILKDLAPNFTDKTLSEGHIIGLSREGLSITLEPGAQIEFSIGHQSRVLDIISSWQAILGELEPILKKHHARLHVAGYQPVTTVDKIPLIPKRRYTFMDRYFTMLNGSGPHMMKGTASIHVSVDYSSEEHMGKLYRVFYRLLPVLGYMTENTPVFDGEPNTMSLRRMKIWENVDPKRVDIEPFLNADRSITFEKYLEFIEQAPLIVRQSEPDDDYDTAEIGKIMEEDVLSDKGLTHLMSMVFPFIRIKNYLEIRVADSMPPRETQAYLCLIKGLCANLDEADAWLGGWLTEDDYDLFRICDDIRENGLETVIGGRTLHQLILECLSVAERGLPKKEEAYLKTFAASLKKDGHLMAAFIADKTPSYVSDSDELNQFAVDILTENPDILTHDRRLIKATLESSGYKSREKTITGAYPPKIYSSRVYDCFETISKTMYAIAVKAMALYKRDEKFRALFGFDKKTEELILIDSGLDGHLPIIRADMFLNEKTGQYYFCEFNGAGSNGMIESRELANAFLKTELADKYRQYGELKSFEMFDILAEKFVSLYKGCSGAKDAPVFAIVDFLEKAMSLDEFECFRQSFEKQGVKTVIADVRSLVYDDGQLKTDEGLVIDAIYRRAVTSDIMEHYDEAEALIRAYRDHKVILLGGFDTQVIDDKAFMTVINDPYALSLFTEEEQMFIRRHFPLTLPFTYDNEQKLDLIRNRRELVLKPRNTYGSEGVLIGRDVPMLSWVEQMCRLVNKNYLVQTYIDPWRSRHVSHFDDETDDKAVIEFYYNMTGLYIVDGEFTGIYSRVSDKRMINTKNGGMNAASLVFEANPDAAGNL